MNFCTPRSNSAPIPAQVTHRGLESHEGLAGFNFPNIDPLVHFPVAILSKALDLARSIRVDSALDSGLSSIESCPERRMAAIVGLVLEHSRQYWDIYHDAPVEFIRDAEAPRSSSNLALRCPNDLMLQLPTSFISETSSGSGNVFEPFLLQATEDTPHATPEKSRETVPLFDIVKEMISCALQRGVVRGAPSLVFPDYDTDTGSILRDLAVRVLAVLYNSPYDPRCQQSQNEKRRFEFIKAINSGHVGESRKFVTEAVASIPKLLGYPGWCGGTPLHKTCQLGNIELMKDLANIARSEPKAPRLETLLTARDADGCTPLHLARRFGKDECADLLIELGSPHLVDRYGYQP